MTCSARTRWRPRARARSADQGRVAKVSEGGRSTHLRVPTSGGLDSAPRSRRRVERWRVDRTAIPARRSRRPSLEEERARGDLARLLWSPKAHRNRPCGPPAADVRIERAVGRRRDARSSSAQKKPSAASVVARRRVRRSRVPVALDRGTSAGRGSPCGQLERELRDTARPPRCLGPGWVIRSRRGPAIDLPVESNRTQQPTPGFEIGPTPRRVEHGRDDARTVEGRGITPRHSFENRLDRARAPSPSLSSWRRRRSAHLALRRSADRTERRSRSHAERPGEAIVEPPATTLG